LEPTVASQSLALGVPRLLVGMSSSDSLLGAIFGTSLCTAPFECSLDIDTYGILFFLLIMAYMFKALGVICDEYFVPALEGIVEKLQLSPDVAGATFMAAGSSAPEFFTALVATFLIVNEGGVGTIIGSAIFNILVIVGATGYIARKDRSLKIWWYPLTRDCAFYVISVAELAGFLSDDMVEWWEALIMIFTYFLYIVYMKLNPLIVQKLGIVSLEDVKEANAEANVVDISLRASATGTPKSPTIIELGKDNPQWFGQPDEEPPTADKSEKESNAATPTSSPKGKEGNKESNPMDNDEESTDEPPPTGWRYWCRDPLIILWELTLPSPNWCYSLFAWSIFYIGVCTYLMVDSTSRMGSILHIPLLVMGLIFLAAGTSIPDALGSISVAKKGEGDMAVSNALGSNVFDILIGLGVPWFFSGISGKTVHFPGAWNSLRYDILVLALVLGVFVGSLAANKWRLNRALGIVLICFYFVYVIWCILDVYVFKLIHTNPEDD